MFISRLLSLQAFGFCRCNPSKLSNKNTLFSVLLQRQLEVITKLIRAIYKHFFLKLCMKTKNKLELE